MSTILYGNLAIDFLDSAGARVERLTIRQTPRLDLRQAQADHADDTLLGRDEQLGTARAAIRAHRAIEFSATCGYGKSALLNHLAVAMVNDGVVSSSVYVQAGSSSLEDLLQRLVRELYIADKPFKPTPDQCAQLLGQVQGLIVLDDVELPLRQIEDLLRIVPGCRLALSSRQPVLGRHGISLMLPGLLDEAALALISFSLGRSLTSDELPAAQQLTEAVDGQPLHLRQAAALIREGRWSLQQLAEMARHDVHVLDRLSISALAAQERRALAVLALAAGFLLPSDLVAAMGDIAQIGESLGLLHRRGLAEQKNDRFALPICKTERYREILLRNLQLAGALRELTGWLAASSPTAKDSIAAASAALAIAEWSAERGDLPAVVRLIRVAEPILSLAGHWDASYQALNRGLQAAKATGDRAAEALFSHEQGSLALCCDDLNAAQQLLAHALELREQDGDDAGAAVTRHNLQLLQPPPTPPIKPGGSPRRLLFPAGAALLVLIALGAGVVKATTSGSAHQQPGTVTVSPTQATTGKTSPASQPASGGSTAPSGGISTRPDGGRSTTPSGGGRGTSGGPSSSPALQPPAGQAADFKSVDITPGQTPASEDIAIRNPNTQPIEITAVQASAPFSITADTCTNAQPIQAQASCSITVLFAPTALGASTGTLTINSAAGQSTTQLSGTGYAELTISIIPKGKIVQDDSGLICDQSECTEQITGPVTLTAPSKGFKDWKGACSGFIPSCALNLTADEMVTAEY